MDSEILEIAQLGQAVLRKKAMLVENLNQEISAEFIQSMKKTMISVDGVGLAAPQIFKSLRVFIMRTLPTVFYPNTEESSSFAVINPKIIDHSDKKITFYETCLSMPGLRGKVPRYKTINVSYINEDEKEIKVEYSDFASIIFPHEFDHLNGIVWIDRIEDTNSLMTEQEYQRQMNTGELQ